ncbi:SMI1/KNR4 family protein [Streptomyces zingiberis]|uniref:SMI1/KNR4 family protein n=1 Tax=Streptomyces zingiberis TaxID=2053010 RepID=A0ABX1C473_9ACTN|nr:SMI1/KNR4 family protein [Streptomyces zingiberis]NJQ02424.1 SMI1/KNR4 family protein [Streptomyces zingiberis]
MIDTDSAALGAAWDRFASWLSTHTPIDHAALRPAASPEEIAGLETRLGFPLHPQLRALLERHNGVVEIPEREYYAAGAFLPLGHRLNSTDQIARQHEMLKNIGFTEWGMWEEHELCGHAHRWVPFAHPNDGGTAFVDHHPGPTYGHVYEMGIGSGDIDGVLWGASLAELFDRLATCLESGEPFQGWWPTPLELPSGHFCLDWDHDLFEEGETLPEWPAPRRPVPPVRQARPPAARPQGRLLGRGTVVPERPPS